LATEASETVATRFVAGLQAEFEKLRDFPLAGPAREQLGVGLRAIFHNPYAIYYLPQTDAVVIIRVIHEARDVAAIAERGGLL